MKNFISESWNELKKVHFPTRAESIQMTIVVFALIIFSSIFLGLIDLGVGSLMKRVLSGSP